MGFLRSFKTHQLLSSKQQITIALVTTGQGWKNGRQRRSYLVPLETTSLFSYGLQRTKVAARLTFSNTKVGFRSNRPVSREGSESTRARCGLRGGNNPIRV